MYVLLMFFMTTTGAVSTAVAEFNTAEACESARYTVQTQAPGPTKVTFCVAK